jgi:hypothetical protein
VAETEWLCHWAGHRPKGCAGGGQKKIEFNTNTQMKAFHEFFRVVFIDLLHSTASAIPLKDPLPYHSSTQYYRMPRFSNFLNLEAVPEAGKSFLASHAALKEGEGM